MEAEEQEEGGQDTDAADASVKQSKANDAITGLAHETAPKEQKSNTKLHTRTKNDYSEEGRCLNHIWNVGKQRTSGTLKSKSKSVFDGGQPAKFTSFQGDRKSGWLCR